MEETTSKEDKLFNEIKLRGKPLTECELVYKGKYDSTRLYVVKEKSSFWAHAVEFHSCGVAEGEDAVVDYWEDDELVVNTLFEVTAYFDGVRHLEFNRNGGDMDGYLYYPPMADLIAMLQKVREIELEICWDAE